jgi:hypothetical protein
LGGIVSRTFEREKDELNSTSFTGDVIEGLLANLVRGDLGLIRREAKPVTPEGTVTMGMPAVAVVN